MKTWMTCAVLIVAGCATVPEGKLGDNVSEPTGKVKISLLSKGQLIVAQDLTKLFKSDKKATCENVRNQLSVSVKRQGEAGTVTTDNSCAFERGKLVTITKQTLPKGVYTVDIDRSGDLKRLDETPVVLARYDDPEFASGSDSILDGAKELPSGQTSKGSISYQAGNMTDWIKIKGKNTQVGLTFLDASDDKDLSADLYYVPEKGKRPIKVGILVNRKKKMVKVKDDNYYVRVMAKNYRGEGNYALVRADGASTVKAQKIAVVDCYRVSDSESVVLLQKTESMKVEDEVSVFGKMPGGEVKSLGKCHVTSLNGDQASCRLESGLDNNYIEYRAEAAKAESEGKS